jgi:AraC family transcriptional regulator
MRVYIKNMVCNRCINAVKQLLETIHLPYCAVNLGEVELEQEPTAAQLDQLKDGLQQLGFELLDDTRKKLIERIKTIVIAHIHHGDEADRKYNFSDILSSQLHKDYSYLSHLFSEVEGLTIEQYIIRQKIEKAKELLVYDELSLSQIAFDLGYSSVAHLSAQFKKVTGLTPSHFKKMGSAHRHKLDQI